MIQGYKPILDTHFKREQEIIIVNKVSNLLKNGTYSLNEDVSYEEFLKIYKLDTVVKHFNEPLTDSEFRLIINTIKQIISVQEPNNNSNINNDYISYQKQLTARASNSIYRDKKEEKQLYE